MKSLSSAMDQGISNVLTPDLSSALAKEMVVREKLIVSDPEIMAGQPVIAGTRLTVDTLLESLAGGATIDQILEAHPALSREGIEAALRFAAETVRASSPVSGSVPLEIYGPHCVNVNEEPGIAIRAFVPEAQSVAVQRQETATGEQGLRKAGSGSPKRGTFRRNHIHLNSKSWICFPASAPEMRPDPLLPAESLQPRCSPWSAFIPKAFSKLSLPVRPSFSRTSCPSPSPMAGNYVAHDPYSFPRSYGFGPAAAA